MMRQQSELIETCLNVFDIVSHLCLLCYSASGVKRKQTKMGNSPQGGPARQGEEKERENKKVKEQKKGTGEQEKASWLPMARGGKVGFHLLKLVC